MKRLALAFALAACGAGPTDTADAGPDAGTQAPADAGLSSFQQAVVDAHNLARANAMPAPSPALPLVNWSTRAQALAEDWAARCVFEHRDPNSLGENLFASTRETPPADVIADWADERVDYTYSTNTCRIGRDCGHYTQIVWRSSVGVGCAQQRCTSNSPFSISSTWFLFVCNYDPAGNFVGQKPY
ncbi:MAG TPA: CAP domain-containing protein [Archangium sp.]